MLRHAATKTYGFATTNLLARHANKAANTTNNTLLHLSRRTLADDLRSKIPKNEEISTGMERKEELQTGDIFWSREPITGPRGTRDNPAIVPSFNDSRVVGLETDQGVIWFRLSEGPLHLVDNQYFKLKKIESVEH